MNKEREALIWVKGYLQQYSKGDKKVELYSSHIVEIMQVIDTALKQGDKQVITG